MWEKAGKGEMGCHLVKGPVCQAGTLVPLVSNSQMVVFQDFFKNADSEASCGRQGAVKQGRDQVCLGKLDGDSHVDWKGTGQGARQMVVLEK